MEKYKYICHQASDSPRLMEFVARHFPPNCLLQKCAIDFTPGPWFSYNWFKMDISRLVCQLLGYSEIHKYVTGANRVKVLIMNDKGNHSGLLPLIRQAPFPLSIFITFEFYFDLESSSILTSYSKSNVAGYEMFRRHSASYKSAKMAKKSYHLNPRCIASNNCVILICLTL